MLKIYKYIFLILTALAAVIILPFLFGYDLFAYARAYIAMKFPTNDRPSNSGYSPYGKEDRFPKNNNPGNIKLNDGNAWKGKVKDHKGKFEKFTDLEYGVRAMLVLLNNYIKKGYDTVDEIIARYAPPSDNNPTSKYAEFIKQKTGITGTVKLEQLPLLAYHMVFFEQGYYVQNEGYFQFVYDNHLK